MLRCSVGRNAPMRLLAARKRGTRRPLQLYALFVCSAPSACAGGNGDSPKTAADGSGAAATAITSPSLQGTAGSSTARAGAAGGRGGAPPVIAAGVRWVGRVDVSDARAIKLAWSGSGFVGSFSGAIVSAKLKTVG